VADPVPDYFQMLDLPRLPWLEPEEVRAQFLKRSAIVHPDRVHGGTEADRQAANQEFAALNAAYNCLRDPKERVFHLLDLERKKRPRDVQRIPSGTMDLFLEVGQLCREVDGFLAERARASSPMVKVAVFSRGLEWTEKIQALSRKVGQRRDELHGELERLNLVWGAALPVGSMGRAAGLPLDRMEQLYRVLSYTSRWTEQLQERLVLLAF